MALGNCEIISADSRQVYRGMDLGTGKDLEEYGSVPYHLIDICPAGSKYNLFEYLRDANAAIEDIEASDSLWGDRSLRRVVAKWLAIASGAGKWRVASLIARQVTRRVDRHVGTDENAA